MAQAVGILEVYGLVAAFVACDAGCKAADVTVDCVSDISHNIHLMEEGFTQ